MNDKRGFTIIEMLVVAVLGALVVIAAFNVLITNQRIYTVQTAHMQGQQMVRAGMDVLYSELREISAREGDIMSMGSNALTVRVPRASGVICDTVTVAANPDVYVINLPILDTTGSPKTKFASQDSVILFAEHDSSTTTDDTWNIHWVQAVEDTTCEDYAAQKLSFTGGNIFSSDTPTLGSLMRAYTPLRFYLDVLDGETWLFRQFEGTRAALVGPLASNGVTFSYRDASGAVTTDSTLVRQIQVTVRTQSDVIQSGDTVADSLSARVYTRNE